MRKTLSIFIGVFLFMLLANTSKACDICGCGVGGYYSGVLPQFHKHIIGLRWRYSSFRSHLDHQHNGVDALSKEHFHTAELWGRFYPHRRVQILAYLPVSYHFRQEPNVTHHLVGLSDASVMVLYNVYNSAFLAETKTKHNVLLGGGVKAPTGSFRNTDADDVLLSPNIQLGTGSVDFITAAMYTFRQERWGVNTNLTYKINLANADGYRFGNQFSGNIMAFWLKKFEESGVGIMPQLGISIEHSAQNTQNGFLRAQTGGFLSSTVVGLEIYYKQWNLALTFFQPAWQDISDGQVHANPRGMVSLNYMF